MNRISCILVKTQETVKMIRHWNRLPRVVMGSSVLGGVRNPTGRSHGQPAVTFVRWCGESGGCGQTRLL